MQTGDKIDKNILQNTRDRIKEVKISNLTWPMATTSITCKMTNKQLPLNSSSFTRRDYFIKNKQTRTKINQDFDLNVKTKNPNAFNGTNFVLNLKDELNVKLQQSNYANLLAGGTNGIQKMYPMGAGVILQNNKREFLVCTRRDGHLGFPAGFVDEESVKQIKYQNSITRLTQNTATKELWEETGIFLKNEDIKSYSSAVVQVSESQYLKTVFYQATLPTDITIEDIYKKQVQHINRGLRELKNLIKKLEENNEEFLKNIIKSQNPTSDKHLINLQVIKLNEEIEKEYKRISINMDSSGNIHNALALIKEYNDHSLNKNLRQAFVDGIKIKIIDSLFADQDIACNSNDVQTKNTIDTKCKEIRMIAAHIKPTIEAQNKALGKDVRLPQSLDYDELTNLEFVSKEKLEEMYEQSKKNIEELNRIKKDNPSEFVKRYNELKSTTFVAEHHAVLGMFFPSKFPTKPDMVKTLSNLDENNNTQARLHFGSQTASGSPVVIGGSGSQVSLSPG